MAYIFNGTTIPSSYNITFNSVSLKEYIHNNVSVWKKMPDYLFLNGNQYTEWTDGWVATPWYPMYGQASGVPTMSNGNGSSASAGSTLDVTSANANYNGQGIKPSKKIDFTNISYIDVTFAITYGNYEYSWANVTLADVASLTAFGNGILTAGVLLNGKALNQQIYTIRLDTRSISGSHDLILSYSSGDSRSGQLKFSSVKVT